MTVNRKVLARIKTAPDLELHVTKVRTDDEEMVELRDYAPSLKRYGRGVLLDKDVFMRIVTEEGPAIIERLWPKAVSGQGQEKML